MAGHSRKAGRDRCHARRNGVPIESLVLQPGEFIALSVARHYFSSFAQPGAQGWLGALSDALACYGEEQGPHVAVAVLGAVQTMRQSRESVFRFNSAACPGCSAYVTDNERLFINTMRAVMRGDAEAANGFAAILCEGNDVRAFIRAMSVMVETCGLKRQPEGRVDWGTQPPPPSGDRATLVGVPPGGHL